MFRKVQQNGHNSTSLNDITTDRIITKYSDEASTDVAKAIFKSLDQSYVTFLADDHDISASHVDALRGHRLPGLTPSNTHIALLSSEVGEVNS